MNEIVISNAATVVLSTAVTVREYNEIKAMSEAIGVSLSHVARALVRRGLQDARKTQNESPEKLLTLIKLGS